MIGSAQSAHLVDSVILSRHTACLAPPNVAILRMYTSSESHFLLPAKRLALRMVAAGAHGGHVTGEESIGIHDPEQSTAGVGAGVLESTELRPLATRMRVHPIMRPS